MTNPNQKILSMSEKIAEFESVDRWKKTLKDKTDVCQEDVLSKLENKEILIKKYKARFPQTRRFRIGNKHMIFL